MFLFHDIYEKLEHECDRTNGTAWQHICNRNFEHHGMHNTLYASTYLAGDLPEETVSQLSEGAITKKRICKIMNSLDDMADATWFAPLNSVSSCDTTLPCYKTKAYMDELECYLGTRTTSSKTYEYKSCIA